jgi:hypothetical protein
MNGAALLLAGRHHHIGFPTQRPCLSIEASVATAQPGSAAVNQPRAFLPQGNHPVTECFRHGQE